MKSYLECWTAAATTLFSQALAGEPELVESLPKPMTAGAFGFADGHSEIHKWANDGNWIKPIKYESYGSVNVGPKDYAWVAQRIPGYHPPK